MDKIKNRNIIVFFMEIISLLGLFISGTWTTYRQGDSFLSSLELNAGSIRNLMFTKMTRLVGFLFVVILLIAIIKVVIAFVTMINKGRFQNNLAIPIIELIYGLVYLIGVIATFILYSGKLGTIVIPLPMFFVIALIWFLMIVYTIMTFIKYRKLVE